MKGANGVQSDHLDFLPLHDRVLKCDPVATEEIARHMYRISVSLLRRKFLVLSRDDILDAVSDALISYYKSPDKYNPNKSSLVSYLTMIAEMRLRDQIRRNARIWQRLSFIGSEAEWEIIAPSTDPFGAGHDELSFEMRWVIDKVFPDNRDRRMVELVAQGRNDWQDYAIIMELHDESETQQKVRVKRARDRIMKRLYRARNEFEGTLQ